MSGANLTKKYVCQEPNCSYQVDYMTSFHLHMMKHRNEYPFPCTFPECEFKCRRECELKRHSARHTGVKPFKCTECTFETSREDYFKVHLSKHKVENKPFTCDIPECTFRGRQLYDVFQHKIVDHGITKPYECEECEFISDTLSKLHRHVKRNHGEYTFICPCDNCEFKSRRKDGYENHLLVHTGEKPFMCDFQGCDFKTARADYLQYHKMVHSNSRPYACDHPTCTFRSRRRSGLKIHKWIHSGEKMLQCRFSDCNFKTNHFNHLKDHKKKHLGIKPYVCDFDKCNSRFLTSAQLREHKKSHSETRPYVCNTCNASFKRRDTMKDHMLSHSKSNKQFKCNVSGCAFESHRKNSFDTHQNVHTKPFRCDFCNYSGATKYLLSVHMLDHTGERPFICKEEMCDYKTKTQVCLQNHINCMHSKEGIQRKKRTEERLANELTKQEITFVREHSLDISCAQRDAINFKRIRMDFVHICNNVIHIIENDEFQHEHYSLNCECRRMADIYFALVEGGNTLPVVIYRFNPHEYYKDDEKQEVSFKERVSSLIACMKEYNESSDDLPPFTIHYLFYDTTEDSLEILEDEEYPQELKPIVRWT